MKVKEESENSGLNNIRKNNMTTGPNTLWQIDRETVETVRAFILGAPKSLQMVTAAMKLKDSYSLGHGNPLQYSWLVDPMDSGAW